MTTPESTKELPATAHLPSIQFATDSDTPLYRQIHDWFRDAILVGHLAPGRRVPSTRSLALHLQISRAPVLVAYELLLAEGYLESQSGAGTRVSSALSGQIRKRQNDTGTAHPAKGQRTVGGLPVARVWSRDDPWWHHPGAFRVGMPDTRQFPTGVWSSLFARHARARAAAKTLGSMGHPPLRAAIAEYLRVARGVRCDVEQIMIVNGAQHGLQIATRVLLGPGDAVWMEEPGYWGARAALTFTGAHLVPVPVDAEGMDIEEGMRRKSDARVAYVTPAHQFPLGSTMSATRRLMLLAWATRSDAWILEDDYDSEFRFQGQPIPALQSLDDDNRVIYTGTFSKVIAPAVRIGYVVIPTDLVPLFQSARQAIDLASPILIQQVLADFLRGGHFARHVRRVKQLYAARREVLIAAIKEFIDDDLSIVGTTAGLHLVGQLPEGSDDVKLARRLGRAGISAAPLSSCYIGHGAKPGLILGYGTVEIDAIRKAAKALASIVHGDDLDA